MESQDDVEAAKKQSPLRVVEVDFVFSLNLWTNCPEVAASITAFTDSVEAFYLPSSGMKFIGATCLSYLRQQ